jgi:hypothetical protein
VVVFELVVVNVMFAVEVELPLSVVDEVVIGTDV